MRLLPPPLALTPTKSRKYQESAIALSARETPKRSTSPKRYALQHRLNPLREA